MFLPRPALMTIYKAFVRPHLDYGDVIYDEAYNKSFHQKLESIQYNTCLALLGTIRGSSLPKIRSEIPPSSTLVQKTLRILLDFKENKPVYLFNLIATKNLNYNTRNTDYSISYST